MTVDVKPLEPIDKALERLVKLKEDGIKELDYKVCTELLGMLMQQLAPVVNVVLNNDPNVKNYLSMSFVGDKNEEIFKVFFVKKDGKLPFWLYEEDPYKKIEENK